MVETPFFLPSFPLELADSNQESPINATKIIGSNDPSKDLTERFDRLWKPRITPSRAAQLGTPTWRRH
jgi:hypothetical protein